MKKLFAVLLAAMMFTGLFAGIVSADQVEVRFTWWGDTARHERYNAICDAFEAENPDVKIIREPNTWADYWDNLAKLAGAGDAPDIMGMHPQFASDYAGRGVLADLQPYMDSGVIDTTDIPESVLVGGMAGDLMCMVSQGITFTNLVANKTLLDEVGVEIPDSVSDWTWSEFAAKAKEFRQKALDKGMDIWFCDEVTGFNSFRYLARSHGGDLYTVDGQLGFNADTVAQWWAFWKDLRDADAIPDAALTLENGTRPLEERTFTLGETAILCVPINQLWLYQAQMGDADLQGLRMPTEEDGRRGEFLEGAHLAAYASGNDAKIEASARFISFFVNSEKSLEYMLMDQGVPANTKMAEFIKPLLTPPNQKAIAYVADTTPLATAATFPPVGASAIDAAFNDIRQTVAYNTATPEAAAAAFIEQAIAILAENAQ